METGANSAPIITWPARSFAQIIYRLEGEPVPGAQNRFPDVGEADWYRNAVVWAYNAGVVTGYSNGNFGPADKITREQMAVMMYRYAEMKGYDVRESADSAIIRMRPMSVLLPESHELGRGRGPDQREIRPDTAGSPGEREPRRVRDYPYTIYADLQSVAYTFRGIPLRRSGIDR